MGVNNIIFIWYEKAICQHNFQIRDSGRKKYEKLRIDRISLSVVFDEYIGGRIRDRNHLGFGPAMIGFHTTDILMKI